MSYMWRCISRVSILFHWFIRKSSCYCHTDILSFAVSFEIRTWAL
jgi:hypothetical protein